MLDSYIPEYSITSINGSGVLKSLQNDSLPELDLLVREAVQNSADAALNRDGNSSNVYFNTGTFVPANFNAELSDISGRLNELYPDPEASFLEIRDMHTWGLVGPVDKAEIAGNDGDHGNYFKLVFENGQEQTNSSQGQAGGSWGYGKSVYYRVGIGMVLFYSRIETLDGFESRLVASLVEHSKTGKSILKNVQKDSIGRAWWGLRPDRSTEQVYPVTDEDEIERMLDIFSVKPFKGSQTGTSIIIPYIDEKRLLKGIFPDECGIADEVIQMCSWKDSMLEYIELALQKWYAPRIFNKFLDNFPEQKWLMARVNGVPVTDTTMRPFFLLVQELYNVALGKNSGIEFVPKHFPDIRAIKISSTKVEGGVAGHLAIANVSVSDFGNTGSAISPYVYLRLFSKTTQNDPIVMYARTPGMVLNYKIDGRWAKNLVKPESEEEFSILFFVPKCDAHLKDSVSDKEYANMALGEYLRKCEKSDHLEWNDANNLTIIANIQKQIISKANAELKPVLSVEIDGTASKLSGRLGRRLLPTSRFGRKKSGGGTGGGSGSGSSTSNNLAMTFDLVERHADSVDLNFKIDFFNSRKKAEIGLFVEDESGTEFDAARWATKIGTPFPFCVESISSCVVKSTDTGQSLAIEETCLPDSPIITCDFAHISLNTAEGAPSVFCLACDITNASVTGCIKIATSERTYRLSLKEVKRLETHND